MNEKFQNQQELKFVDLFSQEMENRLRNEGKIYARKIEPIVSARQLDKPERIETRLPDGTLESVVDAKLGDWVVIGSRGEGFHLSNEKFISLYKEDGSGAFIPRERKIIAIKNPFNESILITAPWGTPEKPDFQKGSQNCMLVVSLDESGGFTDDRYIIGDEQMLLNNYNL